MKLSLLPLTSLVPVAAAHFKLDYPTVRGGNKDKMPTYPCGTLSQSSTRTKVSLWWLLPHSCDHGPRADDLLGPAGPGR